MQQRTATPGCNSPDRLDILYLGFDPSICNVLASVASLQRMCRQMLCRSLIDGAHHRCPASKSHFGLPPGLTARTAGPLCLEPSPPARQGLKHAGDLAALRRCCTALCMISSLISRAATYERVLQCIQGEVTGPRAAFEVRHLKHPLSDMKYNGAIEAGAVASKVQVLSIRFHGIDRAATHMLYLLLPNWLPSIRISRSSPTLPYTERGGGAMRQGWLCSIRRM
jgi:hypothetical protein